MYDELIDKMCATFNTDEYPFICEKTGDNEVTCTWDWENALIVGLGSVDEVHKSFKHVVTLLPNKRYKAKDISANKTKSMSFSKGNLSFGAGSDSFSGHQSGFHKEITFGKNKDTGESGVIKFDFDTKKIKGPVKQFLADNGFKKKGLF